MESKDRPHILVIDDDREILKMLDAVLSIAGFRVSSCADGIEGIRIAEEENPDLIILDVLMPGKNGIEVMREIRTNPVTKAIPILLLSAVSDEATVVQGLKGADDYVIKEIRPLELEARIRKILDRVVEGGGGGGGEASPEPQLSSHIPAKIGEEIYMIPLEDILYLEAAGKYCYTHTREKRYLTSFSISELDKRLRGDENFIRINRSNIVNFEHILKVTRDRQKKLVILVAGEKHSELRVGASYLQSVKERLGI